MIKQKFINFYIDVAFRLSELSHARRLKVGAIVVKDDCIVSMGFNGTPAGWDNNCEYAEYDLSRDINGDLFPDHEQEYPCVDEFKGQIRRYRLKTKPEVIHAEMNAIAKLAKGHDGGDGADMFVTHAPCMECAKLIHSSGIKRVFFGHPYRDDSGVKFLKQSGVTVTQIEPKQQT